ncbi:hypothetical protein AXG93_1474s1260 [Marchantia polymorpha subsp. ruderalis]|uniref:Uncharacterized protein n=1 Tax=Marchantia polymorpha subsp. ruderalis TaxID=1480154 RepID=A0A176WAD7_MARPO|nr:hypothetical protein AXG93_1474s1260 [Marchantia polymorpha subsp. ruderalis]
MEKTPIDFSVPESVTGHPFLPLLLMSLKAILSDSSIDYAADQSTVHGKKGLRSQVSELCSFGGPDAVGDYRTHESYTAAAGRDSRVASVSSESEAEAGTQGPTLDSNNLHVLKYVDG